MSKSNNEKKFEEVLTQLESFFDASKLRKAKNLSGKLKDLYTQTAAKQSSSNDFSLEQFKKKKADYFGFSDGACRGNPGPGAWGIVVQDASALVLVEDSGLDEQTTNNRMELMGAIEAMSYVLGQGGTSMCLVSDSKYVLNGLDSWLEGWKKRGWKKADKKEPENIDLWKSIDNLRSKFTTFHCVWVKGHAGHPQNERCDELANEALDNAGY